MKRLTLLLLVFCLLLCACGRKSAEGTGPSQTQTPAMEETEAPLTTEETEPPTTVETEPIEYRHPLNGELLDKPWTGRAAAVTINNAIDALPQHGTNGADILYEFETEGGVTRRLGFFADFEGVDRVGSIRSTRTFFLNTVAAYDAVLIHCGGSDYAMKAQYDIEGNTIPNWEHIDEMFNSSYFFRDTERQKNGYNFEHTLFAKGENLTKVLEDYGYHIGDENGTDYGLHFAEDPEWDGESAQTLSIRFKGGKKTTATYDKETGRYTISQYGKVDVDANTDEELTKRNVLVVFAEQLTDGLRTYYELIGSGEGYLACDGQIIPIRWERPELEAPFTYTTLDGNPAVLGVGDSYIAIVDGSVHFE